MKNYKTLVWACGMLVFTIFFAWLDFIPTISEDFQVFSTLTLFAATSIVAIIGLMKMWERYAKEESNRGGGFLLANILTTIFFVTIIPVLFLFSSLVLMYQGIWGAQLVDEFELNGKTFYTYHMVNFPDPCSQTPGSNYSILYSKVPLLPIIWPVEKFEFLLGEVEWKEDHLRVYNSKMCIPYTPEFVDVPY